MEKYVLRYAATVTGLLILLLVSTMSLTAQAFDTADIGGAEVFVQVSPRECRAGELVVIEIAVQYHDLADVSFMRSDFAPTVTCTEFRTERRLLSSLFSDGGVTDSVFPNTQVLVGTYICRVQASGEAPLGVVTIATGDNTVDVALPSVFCSQPLANPELMWLPVAENAVVGQAFRIDLVALSLPTDAVVSWNVPDDVYLEKVSPSGDVLCSFWVTPLSPGRLRYPQVTAAWVAGGIHYSVASAERFFTAQPGKIEQGITEHSQSSGAVNDAESPASADNAAPSATDVPVAPLPAASNVSTSFWMRCIIVAGFFSVLSGICFLIFRRGRNILKILFACSLLLCAICMRMYINTAQSLVSTSTRLYFIPDAEHGTYTEISAGIRLRRKKNAGNWIYVYTDDGKTGWIPTDTVQEGRK